MQIRDMTTMADMPVANACASGDREGGDDASRKGTFVPGDETDLDGRELIIHQLYDSEKLAALRAMAAGVAHEIGNPLSGVLGILELAQRRTCEAPTRVLLRNAAAELVRVGRMLRELTDFTRADGERGRIDVNEVLRATLTLARYAHDAAPVTVRFAPDAAVHTLVGSRNHLVQACLHLVMNAYDAMRDRPGVLTVRSRQEPDAVVLSFEDTGHGIPRELVPRLFEPFFTTKRAGTGTGLGLFLCRLIIADEFQGRIDLESTPGPGASFTVRLPVPPPRATANARR
jgi:signal transduction histidine kinase